MSIASLRRTPRFPVAAPQDSPGRRTTRRRSAVRPRLLDMLLEDRTLLAFTPLALPTAAYVAGTHLIPITGADFVDVTSLTDGTETVSFSSTMATRTVPTSWGTWGSPPETESATPRALSSKGAQSVTVTFSQPVVVFGVEMEQNTFNTDTLIADFFNGATPVGTVSRPVNSDGTPHGSAADGARLFAASANGATPAFTSVVLHTQNNDNGFAIAQIRYATTAAADIATTKTGPASVVAGANATYTVTVANNGPSDATSPVLSDALPAGTTFVSATAPAGWTLTPPPVGSNGTVFATTPSLAVGATATFTIVAKVAPNTPSGTTISNTASASSTTTDPIGTNNSATASFTTTASADLAITKVDTPDPVNAGDYVTYTITMTNNGPSDAQNYAPSDTLPAGTTPNSFTQTSGPPAGGTLPVGVTATFVLVAHVDPSVPAGTVLTNTVRAISTTPDPNPNNSTATTTTTVSTSADLAVTKTDSPDPVTAGNNLTYSITLTNNGPSDAQAVVLSDAVPTGTTFVSATAPAGWVTSTPAVGGTGTVTFTKPTVATFASATFTVVVHVNANVASGSTISNTATATTTATPDPNNNNNSASAFTTVNASADLTATKTDTPDPVIAGNNVTYTITITNNGPSDAQGWNLSDTLPAGTSLVSIFQTGGPPAGGPLPPGASGTAVLVLHVNANVPAGTVLTNTVRGTSTTPDPNPNNDTGTATTTVATSADLAITKVDTPDPVNAGDYVTYTITITNNGPSDAQNYAPSDTLPAGTTPNSFTQTSGPPAGGTLPAGATATFVLVAHVDSNLPAGTVLTNTVRAISTTPDPNPNNSTATTTTTVSTSADLAVTKTANPSPVATGSNLTYTLTLTNNGPSDAQAVSLSDGIPAGTTFVSATAPAGWATAAPPVGGTGTVTFTKATVATFASATFTIVVNVSSTFTAAAVSNTARASSQTGDPNTNNNTATTNTPVSSPVDLVVTKTASPNPVFPGGNLTYTVTVHNAGTQPALSVKLYDLLPDRTTFVSNSGAPGWSSTNPPVGSSGGIITSTTPSLAGGATATFVIVVRVPDDVRPGNVLTNRAVVTTSSSETNTANNSTTQSVTVGTPVAPAVKSTVATTGGGQATSGKATSPQGAAAAAQDLAIANSGGLVADVLRQKTLSGLFSFGG